MTALHRIRATVEPSLRRLLAGPPPIDRVDVAVSAALLLLGLVVAADNVVTLVLACAAVPLVRRGPITVSVAVVLISIAGTRAAPYGNVGVLTGLVAGYAVYVASTCVARWMLAAPATLAALTWVATALSAPPALDPGYLTFLDAIAATVAFTIIGTAVGIAHRAVIVARQNQTQVRDLESLARDQRTEAVSLLEREALARELHDIVGHYVTAVVVLAEAAQAETTLTPETLPRIADTARSALTELDTLVTSLREPGTGPQTTTPRGLDDLGELLDPLLHSGITASLHVDVRTELPQTVQLTAYRVVQECVTNVMRHAGARTVKVVVRHRDDLLTVSVQDDGGGFDAGQVTRGRGLAGIGERAAGHGGDWSVTPAPGGGAVVRVEIPTTQTPTMQIPTTQVIPTGAP